MSKDTPKIQHAYGKGTADGEVVHGLLHSNGETSCVFINNRAAQNGKHYIAMYKTGEDHLKDGTVCRSMGGFYVRAGDAIKSGQDNGDQAPDISENVPAVYLEAVTNDLVLSAPLGKVRICAQQIELVATGPDEESGNIVIDANQDVIVKGQQSTLIEGGKAVTVLSGQRMDIVAKSVLNTFAPLNETVDASADLITTIAGALAGDFTITRVLDFGKKFIG